MVREAVGGWLHQRYQAAGIEALPELPTDELTPQGQPLPTLPAARKGTLTKLLARHTEAWQQYRQALLDIRVLDPACGSGAFLNQVFDYLHQEGQRVNRELARLSGGQTNVFDLDKHILTHNLFGVDLNAESVEITRLSLWLKTANRYQPLTALDANIRTGNSLIHDPAVAGELAFDWATQFPEIMGAGGFDVVIGNPPYVRVQNLAHDQIDWFKANYKIAFKRVDISLLFFERSYEIINPNGIISFITSNQFLGTEYGENARRFLLSNVRIKKLIDFGGLPVFENATTYVGIFTIEKTNPADFPYIKVISLDQGQTLYESTAAITVKVSDLNHKPWVLTNELKSDVLGKIGNHPQLGTIGNAGSGIIAGMDDVLMLSAGQVEAFGIEKGLLMPLIRGGDPQRFAVVEPTMFIIYPYKLVDNKTVVLSETELQELFPIGYQYLIANKKLLQSRKDSRKTFADRKDWFSLARFGKKSVFNQYKIVSSGEVKEHKFGLDYSGAGYSHARVYAITINDLKFDIKYVLTLLNSQAVKFFLQSFSSPKQGGYFTYSSVILNQVPIPVLTPAAQQPFIDAADQLLALTAQVQQQRQEFLTFMQVKLGLTAPSRKLQGWDALAWPAFAAELKKAKVVLTLAQEAEWLPLLQQRQQALRTLTAQAATQDRALDQLVYTLYGLTKPEIALVTQGAG